MNRRGSRPDDRPFAAGPSAPGLGPRPFTEREAMTDTTEIAEAALREVRLLGRLIEDFAQRAVLAETLLGNPPPEAHNGLTDYFHTAEGKAELWEEIRRCS